MKRQKRICCRHTPPAIRRRQTLRAQSTPRRNAAPLCQDDDPQNGPVTNSLRFASVTLQPNQLDQRITPLARRESPPASLSQHAALKCVDALARLRGKEQTEPCRLRGEVTPSVERQPFFF